MIHLHGLDISYFTGKVEVYLRLKGLDYQLVPMDTRTFRRLGKVTGVAQMPQMQLPDGTWLTDSTHIIETLERQGGGPHLYPRDAALCFIAHLLEDFADEWLWRPAMAYRWCFPEDALRAGTILAHGMLRDVPLPIAVRRWMITRRQRARFVRGDGVNDTTRESVLAIYPQMLALLQPLLAHQPYLMGTRPTQADCGLFGSMYRHFASDPTPAALMQAQAPAVAAWVKRLWNTPPGELVDLIEPHTLPDALLPLLGVVITDYLPYLQANRNALQSGTSTVRWTLGTTTMCTPASPYRAHCLGQLGQRFGALNSNDANKVQQWLTTAAGHPFDFG